MKFRDLGRQYQALRVELDTAMQSVLTSTAFINGEAVQELERELEVYVGMNHCVTCANGTDALQLALRAMGIGPGDAVFVPDFTFFASAEVVAAVGATPVFVDVDEETFNMSVESLQEAYDRKSLHRGNTPKAVMTVDLFGLPAAYPQISDFARKHSLMIIEDAAQGFGGAIDGRKACSLGDISATSFFPAKPLGCYGDGGAVFTNDARWAELMESLKVHGKGGDKYDNVRIGVNSRLDTLQAAILRVKLRALERYELDEVERVASTYTALLENAVVTPRVPEGYTSSWAQYTIQLESSEVRTALQAHLKSRGVPSVVYYPKPMHLQTAFSYLQLPGSICPTASQLCETVLSLPMHPYMTREEIELVAGEILLFLGK